MIYINPMPESCSKCQLIGTNGKICWCPLLLDENNDCVEIEDKTKRLSECTLKPLVLCGECWKWKTIDCPKMVIAPGFKVQSPDGEQNIINYNTDKYWRTDYKTEDGKRIIAYPDPDDFCKDGEKA